MAERVNRVIIIIGGRGTGKTTYLLEKILKANRLPKVLVVDTFPHPSYEKFKTLAITKIRSWKKGFYRLFGSDTEEIIKAIDKDLTNSLLVFEDCTKYIKSNVQDSVRKLVIDSKQKNLDIVFMYHSIGLVPPDIFRLSDYIVLFKTNEQWDNSWKKIPEAQEVKKVYDEVSIHKSKYFNKSIRISG